MSFWHLHCPPCFNQATLASIVYFPQGWRLLHDQAATRFSILITPQSNLQQVRHTELHKCAST